MLVGGLALFLYGMKMMSEGLELAAGDKLKGIIEKLTTNRFLGVAVGAVITALIQSSSATTVMVVGFVNSGLMTLSQAVWVIMGANIGTTITGQLIALDIGALAPAIAMVGVILVTFIKRKSLNHIGEIVAGLGILFIGMGMMSDAMIPLRESATFIQMMTSFSNPVIGILVGALFTAIIQSSSASVGILQTLARSGLIGLRSSVFVLFGQNIGTCITAVLASIGTSKNAKRTTLIHLMFNIFGTILFTVICLVTPLVGWMEGMTGNPAAQIANMHTLFNVVTTLLLLPFGQYMARLSTRILKDGKEEEEGQKKLFYLKDSAIGSSAIAVSQLKNETNNMLDMAKANVHRALDAVLANSTKELEKIKETEEYIDYLNIEITRHVTKFTAMPMSAADAETVNSLFKVISDIERIGDHAINIAEYVGTLKEYKVTFSSHALGEIRTLAQCLYEGLDAVSLAPGRAGHNALRRVMTLEQQVDDLNQEYRQSQMERIHAGSCNADAGVFFSELLTDMERISDHTLNLAEEFDKVGLI